MNIGIIGAGNIGGALAHRFRAAGHNVAVSNSRGPESLKDFPESRWVEQQLGHPVVKAFNNIYAQSLKDKGKPAGTPGRIALPVAADDPKAKATVMRLIDEIGFDSVDTGTIADSWRQQPGSPVYTKDFDKADVTRALSEASPERTADWRATPNSPGTYEQPR